MGKSLLQSLKNIRKYIKNESEQNIKLHKNNKYNFKWLGTFDDFYNVYINYNLSVINLMKIFNVSESKIRATISHYKIKKSPKQIYQVYKRQMNKKYGVDNFFQSKIAKENSGV